jgi:hypothetical protein
VTLPANDVSDSKDNTVKSKLSIILKEKALAWIDSAPSLGEQSISKQKLIAKIIQDF